MNPEQLIVIWNIKMQFNIMQKYLYLYNYKVLYCDGLELLMFRGFFEKRIEHSK